MGHSRPESLLREVGRLVGLTIASPDTENPDVSTSGEADWEEAYTTLLAHTSLSYEEIGNRTIPQIEAIMTHLGKHISLKIGVPGGFAGGTPSSVAEPKGTGHASTRDDLMEIARQFAGIG